jgi:hypothetical protein
MVPGSLLPCTGNPGNLVHGQVREKQKERTIMGERTIQVQVADHLKTPEVQKALAESVEARTNADYECFQVLREMADQEMLTEEFILAGLEQDSYFRENRKEAQETAKHFATTIAEVLQARRDADLLWTKAMRGQV